MTKNFRLGLAVLAMTATSVVAANTLSFETGVAGSSFSNSVLVTPTLDNTLSVLVNGGLGQYSALSLLIDGEAVLSPATLNRNRLTVISFNDASNVNYLLKANQTYTLTVMGTVASSFVGNASKFTIGSTNANLMAVTPVPEPESWAMLLAGLGFVGFVARRRARKV